ncbi:hypothetical protein KL86DES1_10802 [uncultured Desulfovibrio sp.]|uniref:Uncharacterized protein n=1 Tax=uncultured Desulfovibrio sp. TaxID=167968 RepID=A0A212L0H2_9BACT|nr:hypothetical protein KL86DES1_10802 [uncultured Desulfovibrio sp.]VZH32674.1 conserved protein of unknown function [Desulfovibrio sp. 86]
MATCSARLRNTSWPCWRTKPTSWPGTPLVCAWRPWVAGMRRAGIFLRPCATSRTKAQPRKSTTILAMSAKVWVSAAPPRAITASASRQRPTICLPIYVSGSCASRAAEGPKPAAITNWPPPLKTPPPDVPAWPGGIWPVWPPGSARAAKPVNCCTKPCCAIRRTQPPCCCWPISTLTATKTRPWPNCWLARARVCTTDLRHGRPWPAPCEPWTVKTRPGWPKPEPCWAEKQNELFFYEKRGGLCRPFFVLQGAIIVWCFVGEGPFCKRVSSPTPPPPKTFIGEHFHVESALEATGGVGVHPRAVYE